ncbi:hypothetical protein EPN83_00535 [Patescibacteria group bacterium]|nr:MAG: hypothetical protein EPN83_00535 [Patescibacteria group bacterium]
MTNLKQKTRKIRVKGRWVTIVAMLSLLPLSFALAELPSNETPYPEKLYAQCFDSKDNDGDGKIDLKDVDCPKCADGIDNDGDGFIDQADSDCPKKIGFWRQAAAAVLGVDTTDEGTAGAGFPSGGTVAAGGTIAAGGAPCSGRVVVFQRRVRTATSFYLQPVYTTCINQVDAGGEIGTIDDPRDVPVGGEISAGGRTASSERIQAGGTVPAGGTISSGGTITTGGTLPGGGTVTSGGKIIAGGAVEVSSSINVGGKIQGGGIVDAASSVISGGRVSAGGSIPAGGTI